MFKCNECGYAYTIKAQLDRHRKLTHKCSHLDEGMGCKCRCCELTWDDVPSGNPEIGSYEGIKN